MVRKKAENNLVLEKQSALVHRMNEGYIKLHSDEKSMPKVTMQE